MNLRPPQRHVLAPEGGEANVAVVAGVAVPADPEQADVEQSDRQSERPIALALAPTEQGSRGGSGLRGVSRELEHVVVLLVVSTHAPQRVVQVLSAPLGIEAG